MCSENYKKRKIGILLDFAPDGGGTFQYNLCILDAMASLPKDKYDVLIVYVGDYWSKYLSGYKCQKIYIKSKTLETLLNKIWRRLGLPVMILRKILKYLPSVSHLLISQRCDLWVLPSQNEYSYCVEVPALAAIHDLMHRYEKKFPEVYVNGIYKSREFLFANICKSARGILVDSAVGKMQVCESYGIPAEKVFILPYIAPNYFIDKQHEINIMTKYKLPDKFVFYPAQFWEHKNHCNLIMAIAEVKNKYPDINLVLVGSKKNAYEKIIVLVKSLNMQDCVRILGYVPDEDMPMFYKNASALIMPTFFGPTNIPPLEAFALGCPVAVSGIYGIPDQVGDAALLFDPKSVKEIAECINKLWSNDDLCRELVEKGKARHSAWGQSQFNERLLQILGKLVY